MWLPITGMLSSDVLFLNPDPDTTIVVPGNSERVITCSTYDAYTGGIYTHSGRGFTVSGLIKPDLAAPGVNVSGPNLRDGYTNGTGSGMAAAITAGASALILQWGIMRSPSYPFTTAEIKNLLIRGAVRDNALDYPNREWGYGRLNVYGSFSSFLNP